MRSETKVILPVAEVTSPDLKGAGKKAPEIMSTFIY
jgi:hypothetical protein